MGKGKINIIVNNNKAKLEGNYKILNRMYKAFKVKHPNAFYLRRGGHVREGWDGNIDYITESYYFKLGLLPSVVKRLREEEGCKVNIVDNRPDFNIIPKVPTKIGDLTPRPYQHDAISSIINNKILGLPFWKGVIDASTNAGKTMIMAGIYLSFYRKIPALILIKDGDLFKQFLREFPELVGNDDLGYIQGKNIKWGNFTIAMVQTLSPKVSQYKNQLAKIGMLLVDEADEGNSKSYKKIITACYNANILVGLSGTIYMSKLKKDLTKNLDLKSVFSEVVYTINKKDLAELGHSTPVVIRIFPGSDLPPVKGDWQKEYQLHISSNKKRAKIVRNRVIFNVKRGRYPLLVVGKMHEHIDLQYKVLKDSIKLETFSIRMVHGGTPKKERDWIFEQFRIGKIDILVSSFIIKRGKNHPLIKCIINAAGSDSQETVSQLMGRGERTHESKKKYYMEDFMDSGSYMRRHSKHRAIYYAKHGFKLIKKY
jgi:superfamily II DNA or RNA helicase